MQCLGQLAEEALRFRIVTLSSSKRASCRASKLRTLEKNDGPFPGRPLMVKRKVGHKQRAKENESDRNERGMSRRGER